MKVRYRPDSHVCYFGGGGGETGAGLFDPPNATSLVHQDMESWVDLGIAPSILNQIIDTTGNTQRQLGQAWSLRKILNEILGENPYHQNFGVGTGGTAVAATIVDPASKITQMLSDLDTIKDLVSPTSTQIQQWEDNRDRIEDDWTDEANHVIAYVDGNSVYTDNSTEIDNLVTEFETDELKNHFRSVNRLAVSAATNNATNSSTFIIGQAVLEDGHNQQVRRFRRELQLQFANLKEQHRHQFIINGVQNITGTLYNKLNVYERNVQSALDIHRMDIVSTREYNEDFNTAILKDRSWGLDSLQEASGVIAGMKGAMPSGNTGREMNKTASALSGTLTGAVAGAQATKGNPIGVGIGAAIGLLAGLAN